MISKRNSGFKETSVGQIPVDWKVVVLSNYFNIKNGKTNTQDSVEEGEYPLFDRSRTIKRSGKYLFDSEAIIVPGEGKEFIPRYYKGKFDLHQRAYAIIPISNNVDVRFYYYWIMNFRDYLSKIAVGSTVKSLRLNHLLNFPAPFPELSEQHQVADLLSILDLKIELNKQMNKTLESIAQALFKSWFVDFDPVRAKMVGEPPESICKRLKLTPEILGMFTDRLVDSELGKIPEGWEIETLENLAALVTDNVSPRRDPHAVYAHYSIPAFDAGRIPSMELGESIKSNKYVVKHNAVLVSKLNPQTPRIWLPAIGHSPAVCSTEFMQFVPYALEDRPYLYCLMVSQSMQEELLTHVTGSTGSRQRVQPSQIAKVKILFPQSSVRKAFNHYASPLLQAVANNLTVSSTLTALRDTLLPKLISGKIRVPVGDTNE